MNQSVTPLILGEYRRVLDDRFRLSIPGELIDRWIGGSVTSPRADEDQSGTDSDSAPAEQQLGGDDAAEDSPRASGGEKLEFVLAKERPGCLSLWRGADWQGHLEAGLQVVESKLRAGRLGDRLAEVQMLGRLLSTRQRNVQLAGRGRLLIPEGFREFLGVEAGTEVLLVGAAVCIEIWQAEAWKQCLNDEIPRFGSLLDGLSG